MERLFYRLLLVLIGWTTVKSVNIADLDGPMELSAVGRPFELGKLYDVRSEKLIDTKLWRDGDIKDFTTRSPSPSSHTDLKTDDSIDARFRMVEISQTMFASWLCGLLNLTKSEALLESMRPSKDSVRFTFVHKVRSNFDHVRFMELEKAKGKLKGVDLSTATHVVTGIRYGADTYYVFERPLQHGESAAEVRKTMAEVVKSFGARGGVDEALKILVSQESKSITYKVYSDVFDGVHLDGHGAAIDSYVKHQGHFHANRDELIPKDIWLFPLDKMDIGVKEKKRSDLLFQTLRQLVDTFQSLHDADMESSDLLKREPAKHFLMFRRDLRQFSRNIQTVMKTLRTKLSQLLPKIREGIVTDQEIQTLLGLYQNSPFKAELLKEWLEKKLIETEILNIYLIRLMEVSAQPAFDPGHLQRHIGNASANGVKVLNFVFRVHDKRPDAYLELQGEFLLTNQDLGNETLAIEQGWHDFQDITAVLNRQARRYYKFAKLNNDSLDLKFIISSELEEDDSLKGGHTRLHDNGTEAQIDLPGPPVKVDVKTKGSDAAVVTWGPPEQGVEQVVGYEVIYYRLNERGQTAMREELDDTKVNLNHLGLHTTYGLKVRAKSTLGIGIESDQKMFTTGVVHPEL